MSSKKPKLSSYDDETVSLAKRDPRWSYGGDLEVCVGCKEGKTAWTAPDDKNWHPRCWDWLADDGAKELPLSPRPMKLGPQLVIGDMNAKPQKGDGAALDVTGKREKSGEKTKGATEGPQKPPLHDWNGLICCAICYRKVRGRICESGSVWGFVIDVIFHTEGAWVCMECREVQTARKELARVEAALEARRRPQNAAEAGALVMKWDALDPFKRDVLAPVEEKAKGGMF